MSVVKVLRSFKYAFNGIALVFVSQTNAKIHTFVAIVVSILGFYFQVSKQEWLLLTICIAMVWSAEAFNTAIEHLVDLVSPEYHPLAGKAKDTAAAGVLILAIGAFVVGVSIFLPQFLQIVP